MRQLMVRQKKLLDNWFNKNKTRLQEEGGIIAFDIANDPCFTYELVEELERINDTEILFQEINRYISDKGIEDFVSSGGFFSNPL